VLFFPPVCPGEFSHLFEKPEEGLIGAALRIAGEVDPPDQVLKVSDFQVFSPLFREERNGNGDLFLTTAGSIRQGQGKTYFFLTKGQFVIYLGF
jgi:hypothetical protein